MAYRKLTYLLWIRYYDVMKEADEIEREAERSGRLERRVNAEEQNVPEEPDDWRELIAEEMWRDYRR